MTANGRPPGDGVERTQTERVTVRFAGDSGDGLQVVGNELTNTSALAGNDVATLPDYPAEIRAPVGTLPGVSAFQISFSSRDIHTPGDAPDVLVALNPAALQVHIGDLLSGGMLLVNSDAFTATNLEKAGFAANPLEDGSLSAYRVVSIAISTQNERAVQEVGVTGKEAARSKNFYALGIVYWLYDRPLQPTLDFISARYRSRAKVVEANHAALRAGHNFANIVELFDSVYTVPPAKTPPGIYRNITGTEATALGFVTASHLADTQLFYASYPITPASGILHELAKLRHHGVVTFQAEDEIAAIGAAIGASFGGSLGVTGTSGPGLALKSEALGLAVAVELPVVVADVQRAGPSTGMPTKTEQADLLQAMFGRNGESPVAVVAPATPGDCFHMAIEAFRIAVTYMTPVIFLSDSYLANGSEPWRMPTLDDLPQVSVSFQTENEGFRPYGRDPETLARPWALPGTPGLEHRIGGLSKEEGSGNVSYDPENNERAVRARAEKIAGIAHTIPLLEVQGDSDGALLVLGWGSTSGVIRTACEKLKDEGFPVAWTHLRYVNPFPSNLGDVLSRFPRVLIPELNSGQLRMLVTAKFRSDTVGLNKVQGRPFLVSEVRDAIIEELAALGSKERRQADVN